MEQSWMDITIPMRNGMTGWPGDPEFRLEPELRIADGASCNLSRLSLCTHTGTHCDAPWHFVEDGSRLDQVEPSLFFGPALVIECPECDQIHAKDLPASPLPKRVLFKTRNSRLDPAGPFNPEFAALETDAAERLAADGVKLVGIDYLSIGPHGNGGPVHRILLGAGMLIVEGLLLAAVPPGEHEFIVLPLPIAGGDGAPCRAFIRI